MSKTIPEGATAGPDLSGLLIAVTNEEEINQLEATNILAGANWAYSSRKLRRILLSLTGIETLHKSMFGDVREWAGIIRTSKLNIGVESHQIREDLGRLFADVKYWLAHETHSLDEICIRFHHELTRIHPFTNGNGRFARLAADLLSEYQGGVRFTWGGGVNLVKMSPNRERYIEALKLADQTREIGKLLEYARS